MEEEWTHVTYKKKKTKPSNEQNKQNEQTNYRWADEEFPEPMRYKCGKQFSFDLNEN